MSTDKCKTGNDKKGKKKTGKDRKGKEEMKGDSGSKVTSYLRNLQKTIHLCHTHKDSWLLEWFVLHFLKKKVDEIFTTSEELRAAVLSAPLQKLYTEVHGN